MGEMSTNEIEEIIKKHTNSVVAYYCKDHHGFENNNPDCVGLIFGDDLYLIVKGLMPEVEGGPYWCVESETRAACGP